MNLKSISLNLLIAGIIFSNYQILAQGTVTISKDQEICYEILFDSLTSIVSDTGKFHYQWQDSTSSSPNSWEDIDNANDSIYYSLTGLQDTTYFRLIVETATDTLISNTLRIAVFGEFDVGSISGAVDSTICNGQDGGTLTANPTGGSRDYTITWYKNDELTIHLGSEYIVGPLYETAEFYYNVVDNMGCGEGDSDTITIEVYDTLTAEGITGGQTPICSGEDGDTLIANPAGGSGIYTIKWYRNNEEVGEGEEYIVGVLYDTTDFYYTVADKCDTISSNIFTIDVIDNAIVSVTITVNHGHEICIRETA